MPFTGGCLCGAVRFEVDDLAGPFELCHCQRCRQLTGSRYAATIRVSAEAFCLTQGAENIQRFEAPLLFQPPPYTVHFCSNCGSKVPSSETDQDWLEIHAGLFDTDLPLMPDRHIYAEYLPVWDEISDGLPDFNREQLKALRLGDKT